MTLHVLHAGDGYSYLTSQVAVADRQLERGQELTDYYTAHGTPPGRWHGAGLAALSKISEVSGAVTEPQMKALFGEGRHPNTDQMLEAGVDLSATALGRKFPEFRNENALVQEYNLALRKRAETDGPLDKATTSAMWKTLSEKHYIAKFKRDPSSERELLSWAAVQRSNVREPVAGMDLVFTPQKSVSTLWALADHETRTTIERIHHECVNDSLSWIEREAAFTRRGDRSERQIDTHGLVVAQFDHYDTRAGDPNLHTHCAVSNKVLGVDGKWSALDGAALHKHAVAASQRYNAAIVDRLRRDLGVQFEARYPSKDKQPVWEIAGVDQELCRAFSSRRKMIEARRDELVAAYVEKHGRAPSQPVQYALMQQATLETREGKQESRSLSEHRQSWHQFAVKQLGSEEAVAAMIDTALGRGVEDETTPEVRVIDPLEAEAARAIETVSDTRATWNHAHVRSVVEAQLADVVFASPEDRNTTVTAVVDHALSSDSIALTTPDSLTTPEELRRESDGLPVTERHGELLHTSAQMLDLERDVLDASKTPVPVYTTRAQLSETVAAQQKASGRELNPGQLALAEHFCLSGQLVAAGVGPAGTGKTTSMKAVADTWRSTGRQVIALAPSAVAAETLGEEIGVEGHTLASLTYRWRGKMVGFAARSPDALPVTINPGAMLLLDEAAMASTKDIAALVEIARSQGAVVRLVGDPAQLDAVESGGLMRLVASRTRAPELTDVVRFGQDTEQAKASIALREGDFAALDFHEDKRWLHGGTEQEMTAAAVADHFEDTDSGLNSIVLASTTTAVSELNTQIQKRHRDTGTVSVDRTVDLSDEQSAGRGDIVVTRSNNRGLRTKGGRRRGSRVQNGDRWKVVKVGKDGSLTVRHLEHRGRVTLDPTYVATNTELGYASTVHRAQGITVDVSRTVVGDSTNRRGLYVALTRGRSANHAYTVCDTMLDVDTERPHLAPEVDDRLVTIRGTLNAALARDDGHTTATEELRKALAAADDPQRMADRYEAARTLLVSDWSTELLEGLPTALSAGIRSDDRAAAWRAAIDRHLTAGHDVAGAITQMRETLIEELDTKPVLPDYLPQDTRAAIERDPIALALVARAAGDYTAGGIEPADALAAAVDDLMDGTLHRGADPDELQPVEGDSATPPVATTSILTELDRVLGPIDPESEPQPGELAPLPPRHPRMNIDLAEFAAAAQTEHARLIDASSPELAPPEEDRTPLEAARDRVTSRRVTQLSDKELESTRSRLAIKAGTLEAQVRTLDQKLDAEGPGPAVSAVHKEHSVLDAKAAAIQKARQVDKKLSDAQHAIAGWERRKRELATEDRGLNRFASRRRREIGDEIAHADQSRYQWEDVAAEARSQARTLRAQAGPPETWDRTEAAASDTAARQKQVTAAEAADARTTEQIRADRSEVTGRLEKIRRNIHAAGSEQTRRAGLTDAERSAETQVREELNRAQPTTTAPRTPTTAPTLDQHQDRSHGPEL